MRYQPNQRGVRQWLNSAELQAVVLKAAEDAADDARATAPVGKARRGHAPGTYRASIRAEADRAGDRVGATVTATVPYAQRVEQKHHTIGRAVDGIGR